MISQSSLAQLNTRIAERGGRPVEMDRFRPNLIIDGWSDPHTEDRVRHARIGTAGLRFDRQAVRCSVPLVDQRTGRRAGPEPLRTLATYRRIPAGGLIFGVKFAVADPGSIAVGDDVQVLGWSA
jgi:uncharacterized protein YcbX